MIFCIKYNEDQNKDVITEFINYLKMVITGAFVHVKSFTD